MPANSNSDDIGHMRHALRLASRALGQAAPNPAVGCVIVSRDGRVVGRGCTQAGGRPHAETEALAQAGDLAHGATAYVTLEPCAHHGQTPPCADALISAGIARVVAATGDPDIRVNGQGFARLGAAGRAGHKRSLRSGSAHIECGLLQCAFAQAAARRAEDRGKRRWFRRRRHRQQQVDHVERGAPAWPSPARPARSDLDRHRHGARRRSAAHLPPDRTGASVAGESRGGHAVASFAVIAACAHGAKPPSDRFHGRGERRRGACCAGHRDRPRRQGLHRDASNSPRCSRIWPR